MQKIKKNKKLKIVLISIPTIVLIAIVGMTLIFSNNERFDIEELRKQSIRYYDEYEVKLLDFMDMTTLFGVDVENDENNLMIANVDSDVIKKEDMFLLVVMNTMDVNYYDVFQSYIDSTINHEENEEIVKLFEKAILKRENNYVYLIICDDPKSVEKDIKLQLK